jgi:hypothetical protein
VRGRGLRQHRAVREEVGGKASARLAGARLPHWSEASRLRQAPTPRSPHARQSHRGGYLAPTATSYSGRVYHRGVTLLDWRDDEVFGLSWFPAIASSGPGRLDVFAGDGGQQLMHSFSVWTEGVSKEWPKSPEVLPGKWGGPVAAVSFRDGRLDVFGIGVDGALHHLSREGAGSWDLKSLGGTYLPHAPSVAADAPLGDGTVWLNVLLHQGDKAVLVRTHEGLIFPVVGAPPDPGPEGLPGKWGAVPVAIAGRDGRLEVFGVSPTGNLQNVNRTATGSWSIGASYGSGNFKLLPPAAVAWGSEIFLACLAKDGTLYYSLSALDPGPDTGLTIFMDSIDGGESTLDAPPAVVAQTSPIKLLRILVNTAAGIKLNQTIDGNLWPLPWETVGGAITYVSGLTASWRSKDFNVVARARGGTVWRSYRRDTVIA